MNYDHLSFSFFEESAMSRFSPIVILLLGVSVIALFILVVISQSSAFASYAEALSAGRDLASIVGLMTIIFAAITYISGEHDKKQQRALERVKLTIDLMSRFYGPQDLEDVRRALREHTALESPAEFPHSLRWDEVWVMNYFETLAIAVDEGLLDIQLVNKMVGSPILEVMANPRMSRLVKDGDVTHSYEGYAKLQEKIAAIRSEQVQTSRR